jgi:hypothetical protein
MIATVGSAVAVIVLVLALSTVVAWLFRPRADRPHRWWRVVRAGGIAVLIVTVLVAPWSLFHPVRDDVGAATASLILGLSVIVATGLATRWWPRPEGNLRTVSLTPRWDAVTRTVPRKVTLLASSAVLAVLLIVSSVTALPEGGSFRRTWGGHAAVDTRYPGWGEAIPAGLLTVTVLVATWWALRQVEAQPRIPDDLQDASYRARTATRIVRAALFGVAGSAAWFAITMGKAAHSATYTVYAIAGEAGAERVGIDWVLVAAVLAIGVGLVMMVVMAYALIARTDPRQIQAALHEREPRPGAANPRP